MLDQDLRTQLSAHLGRLTRPVTVVSSTDDSVTGRQTVELLDELENLSPLITHIRGGNDERTPSFTISAAENPEISVTFAGLPMGHEFTSLVLALLHVGGHRPKEDATLLERAARLRGPLTFETFYSQSCQNCPDVVQALNVLAVLNGEVTHTAIDGATYADEATARGVLAVPTVFCNGEVFGHGRMTLSEIVGKLEAAAGQHQRIADTGPYDVLVVGGGPAGVTAAVYAARKGLHTGVVAGRIGGQVLDTMAIENLIAVAHTEGPQLARTLETNLRDHPINVMVPHTATELRAGESGQVVVLEDGTELTARTVVLAPGARWRTLGVPGEETYRNRGVTFCPHCDGPLFAGKNVAVIGGGNSGAEAALDLSGVVAHVTVVEYDTALRADQVLQDAMAARPNIDVITGAATTEVTGDGRQVTGLAYLERSSGEHHRIPVDGVFVQIGLVPCTDWLQGTVELTGRGEIVVDDRGATSLPGVFAAGDATTAPYKQIVTAMGGGAEAAISAFDHLVRHPDLVDV